MPQNSHKNKRDLLIEEKAREAAREFDFGNGSEVIIGNPRSSDNPKGQINYFFSSRLPKLNIGSKIAKRELEIECSSTDEDNQSLLHLLFKENRY